MCIKDPIFIKECPGKTIYLILIQFLEIFFEIFSPTIKQSNRKRVKEIDEKGRVRAGI